MASPIGFDPTHYTSTIAGSFVQGMKYTDSATGYEYRYAKNTTDGAITQGMSCVMASTSAFLVTYSNGASQLSLYAGAGICTLSTVATSLYFFMLVNGIYPFALDASNGVTNGSFVTGKNVNGNFINGVAAQVNKEIGYALANASGGVFPIRVTIG